MKNLMISIRTRQRRLIALNLFGFLVFAALTFGQAATATAQVTITQVFVGVPVADQITIDGSDFDNPNLVVTLGDFATPLDIVPDPTSTQIIAILPGAITAGDYLLTVRTGGGPNRQDDYDLTIGAAVAGIPTSAIILWDQNNICPAGYTRVAAFDGSFLVGGAAPGTTGGSDTHDHGAGSYAGPSHRHNLEPWNGSFAPVDDNSGGTDFNARTGFAGDGTMSGTSGSADSRPVFRTILLCRRS